MDLTNRIARCGCGNHGHKPSSPDLAFFEFRGPGSEIGAKTCKNCGYYEVAHGKPHIKCQNFEPKGSFEFDSYYCGCYGWD